jgi:hypothetical protein
MSAIQLNPFRLDTAYEAWQAPDKSLGSNIWGAVKGAAYDIYVKNPSELTIGNVKKVFTGPQAADYGYISKAATSCFAALGACYTLMLFGGSTFAGGHAIQAAGVSAGVSSVATVGLKVKKLGEAVFLTGSVPVYAATCELPKKIIQSSPSVFRFIGTKIQPLWNRVLSPIVHALGRAVVYLADKIAKVAQWTFSNVIAPLWNHVVFPVLKFTWNIFSPVVVKTGQAIAWVFKHAITPVLKWSSNVFVAVVVKTAEAAAWVFKHAMVPLWNSVLSPVGHALFTVANVTAQAIGSAAVALHHSCSRVWASVAAYF